MRNHRLDSVDVAQADASSKTKGSRQQTVRVLLLKLDHGLVHGMPSKNPMIWRELVRVAIANRRSADS
jgi:hypothetical protein